jgi:hypothetical protein
MKIGFKIANGISSRRGVFPFLVPICQETGEEITNVQNVRIECPSHSPCRMVVDFIVVDTPKREEVEL